jgi:hypothetical protein
MPWSKRRGGTGVLFAGGVKSTRIADALQRQMGHSTLRTRSQVTNTSLQLFPLYLCALLDASAASGTETDRRDSRSFFAPASEKILFFISF